MVWQVAVLKLSETGLSGLRSTSRAAGQPPGPGSLGSTGGPLVGGAAFRAQPGPNLPWAATAPGWAGGAQSGLLTCLRGQVHASPLPLAARGPCMWEMQALCVDMVPTLGRNHIDLGSRDSGGACHG